MNASLYVIWQEENFAACESYEFFADVCDAAKDLLLRTVAEHGTLPVYVCKAVMKFSPDQAITVAGEKLDQ